METQSGTMWETILTLEQGSSFPDYYMNTPTFGSNIAYPCP